MEMSDKTAAYNEILYVHICVYRKHVHVSLMVSVEIMESHSIYTRWKDDKLNVSDFMQVSGFRNIFLLARHKLYNEV